MNYYVYELFNPKNENTYYIGKGCKDRCKQHFRKAIRLEESDKFGNKHLYYKINNLYDEMGKSGLKYKIVETFEDETAAYNFEKQLISEYGLENLCNIRKGGEGIINTPEIRSRISSSVKNWRKNLTEEKEQKLRSKISKGQKKFWNSNRSEKERVRRKQKAKELWKNEKLSKDKVYTDKFVQASMKQSEEVKGKTYEEIYDEEKAERIKEEISEKLSGKNNPQYGKSLDEETKQKISESNSGKSNPNSKTYVVDCNGEIREFETRKEVKEAIKSYNEENNLGWGEKIVYGKLFENGSSKSWEILQKQ